MNQNICPNCHAPNSPDKSFCTNCGRPMAFANQPNYSNQAPNQAYAGSPNVPPPYNTGNQPPPPPSSSPPAKKSRLGLWLAIAGGVGLLAVMVGGLGLLGIYYYAFSQKPAVNYNGNTYSANLNQGNSSTSSGNTSNANSVNSPAAMTEDEKYRLFYAASKVGEQPLTVKISKRIGIIDEANQPTPYYKTFTGGIVKWAMRDTEFVKRVDTKEKARDYINSQMPGDSTSYYQNTNSHPQTASLGVINGKATNLVQPAYPAAARAVRAAGAVNVSVQVDEEGNVISATATSGHPLLRSSSEQAARASKFSPTVLGGNPVKVSGVVVYNYVAE